jgi:hypothetical protein
MPNHLIKKIISGGQTGVDRAALDVARNLKISYGGWCPKDRWAEDAPISENYQNMIETPSSKPEQRTEWNARDSDGTLIILKDVPIGGTQYTIEMAQKYNKPYLIFDLSKNQKLEEVIEWIKNNNIQKLNIAGPRESQTIGIYDLAYNILLQLMHHLHLLNDENKILPVDEKKSDFQLKPK